MFGSFMPQFGNRSKASSIGMQDSSPQMGMGGFGGQQDNQGPITGFGGSGINRMGMGYNPIGQMSRNVGSNPFGNLGAIYGQMGMGQQSQPMAQQMPQEMRAMMPSPQGFMGMMGQGNPNPNPAPPPMQQMQAPPGLSDNPGRIGDMYRSGRIQTLGGGGGFRAF